MMIHRSMPRLKQAASIISRGGNTSLSRNPSPVRSPLSATLPPLPRAQIALNKSNNGLRSLSSAPPKPPTGSASPASSASRDKAQEAIEKAEQLHAELNAMIAAQKARQIEEAQRPFGSEFISFLKKSKAEMINIVFAFVCVLLAYQIHGMRAGIRKLLATQEEKDAEIDHLRSLLATLSEVDKKDDGSEDYEYELNEESFSWKVSQKCADIVRQIFSESEKKVGYSWILGRKIAGGDAMEIERLVEEFQPIISSEIKSIVGDAAYTSEEMKERRVAALQESSLDGSADSMGGSSGDGVHASKQSAQLGGLMEVLQEVHQTDLPGGSAADKDDSATSTKVKRTRYAI